MDRITAIRRRLRAIADAPAAGPVRNGLLVAYVLLVLWWWQRFGIPLERLQVLGWVAGGLLLATAGRDDGGLVRLARDWVPIAVVLAGYDLTRGVADSLGMPVQRELLVRAERLVTFGHVPSVQAQAWLGPYTAEVRWWEVPVSLVYLSHFVVPFAVMGVLWVRDRGGFRRYRDGLLLLTAAGLATYLLVPAAPPWMAARDGLIGPVRRVVLRGMDPFGLDLGGVLVRYGPRFGNQVAALPSLHAGWSTLTALFLARRVRRRWWPLLALYPLWMSVALVISGEHYVLDVVLGALYAVAAVAVQARLQARRCGRRAPDADAVPVIDLRAAPTGAESPPPGPPAPDGPAPTRPLAGRPGSA